MDRQRVVSLVPMAHVADVEASAAFYAALGFEEIARFTPPGEDRPTWLSLRSGGAELMLARASEPDRHDGNAQAVAQPCRLAVK